MSRITNEWAQLNRQAKKSCAEAMSRLSRKDTKGDPFVQICGSFLHKATETLNAINILYAHGLEEPAQSLIRILFELRINFDCFLRLAHDDLGGTVRKVIVCTMLEKIKQARASEFKGMSDEMKAGLLKHEEEMGEQYSHEELKRMRSHGFTQMPIEQRAQLTGHADAYHVIYRNFSRNIHSTDYVESYFKAKLVEIAPDPAYIESRDVVAHYTAHFSAVGIMEFANHVLGLGMDSDIEYLGRRQSEIKALA